MTATVTAAGWPSGVAGGGGSGGGSSGAQASLLSSGLPMVIPPGNGATIGLQFTDTNGAFSLTTTLMPQVFAAAYLWMPIGAFDGTNPVAAGLYYATFSSTSVGQLYSNTYTSGAPQVPASPGAITTTSARWLTQTVGADLTLLDFPIPANSMGPNGAFTLRASYDCPNNANGKTAKAFFGGIGIDTLTLTSVAGYAINKVVRNRGVTNRQGYSPNSNHLDGQLGGAISQITQDTTTDRDVTITGQMTTVNSDYVILESYGITLEYGA